MIPPIVYKLHYVMCGKIRMKRTLTPASFPNDDIKNCTHQDFFIVKILNAFRGVWEVDSYFSLLVEMEWIFIILIIHMRIESSLSLLSIYGYLKMLHFKKTHYFETTKTSRTRNDTASYILLMIYLLGNIISSFTLNHILFSIWLSSFYKD